jgi:hypothetical protein
VPQIDEEARRLYAHAAEQGINEAILDGDEAVLKTALADVIMLQEINRVLSLIDTYPTIYAMFEKDL